MIGNLVRIKGLFSVFTLAYSFSECLGICLLSFVVIVFYMVVVWGFLWAGSDACIGTCPQFFGGSANTIKIDLRHRLLV